ncbi:MAG: SoxR reducing system RseC family protein [Thalassotalea sp.]
MIEEKAQVVAIKGDDVIVESLVKSSCSSCHQVDSCGSGQVAKAIPHRKLTLKLASNGTLNIGDTLILGIPENKLLHSAWQVYFLPLFGLILFAFLGQYFSTLWQLEHEIITILGSLIGGYIGFTIAQRLQSNLAVKANLTPLILRKHLETINIVEKGT